MHHAAASNTVVPLESKTPSGPVKSCLNMAPCPRREATVSNERTSIKQTGFRPCQVKGIWDPGVTHPANVLDTTQPFPEWTPFIQQTPLSQQAPQP